MPRRRRDKEEVATLLLFGSPSNSLSPTRTNRLARTTLSLALTLTQFIMIFLENIFILQLNFVETEDSASIGAAGYSNLARLVNTSE